MKKICLLLILTMFLILVISTVQAENSICKYAEQFQNNKFLQESGFDIENLIDPLTLAFCQNMTNILQEEKTTGKGKLKKDKEISINENRIIEKQGKGRVNFKNSFSVEIENVENDPNIYITENLIAINTEELPDLDQPATIIFYNVSAEGAPRILYNERFTTNPAEIIEPCPEDICYNIDYNKETKTLAFDVSHFSTYYYAWDWGGSGYSGSCSDWLVNRCAVEPDYCKYYIYAYPYDGTISCKPTGFCSEYTWCSASYGSYQDSHWSNCFYKEPAGVNDATCSIWGWHGYYIDSGSCPANCYQNGNWCSCSETSTCQTCEGTAACNIADEYKACYNNCVAERNCCTSWCMSYDCVTGCGNYCRESIGGSGGRAADMKYCQPKQCNEDDYEVGQCYYEEVYEGKSYDYTSSIGQAICPKTSKKWKLCVSDDGDACGEWEDTDVSCEAVYKPTENGWAICEDGYGTHNNCEIRTKGPTYTKETNNRYGTERIKIDYQKEFCMEVFEPHYRSFNLKPYYYTEGLWAKVGIEYDRTSIPPPPELKELWYRPELSQYNPSPVYWDNFMNSHTLKINFNDPNAGVTSTVQGNNQVWGISEAQITGSQSIPLPGGAQVTIESISPPDIFSYKYKQPGTYEIYGELSSRVTRAYRENNLICSVATKNAVDSLVYKVPSNQIILSGSVDGVFGPDGGTLTTQDGIVELDIPSGALSADAVVNIDLIDTSLFSTAEENFMHIGVLNPSGFVFNKPLTITFNYDESKAASEENLDIYLYDNNAQTWVPQNGLIDKANNKAIVKTDHFSIYALIEAAKDSIPPITTLTISSPKYEVGSDIFITLNTQLTLEAMDYGDSPSGVNATYYCVDKIDDCTPENFYLGSFTIADDGVGYVRYSSVDNKGNMEEIKSNKVVVDNSPPEITLDLNPNVLWPPNNKLVEVRVDGNPNDELSGVALTTFSVIDSYGELNPAINAFGDTIKLKSSRLGSDKNGRIYIVEATSIDNVGNTAVTTATVIVPHDMGNEK